MSSKEVGLAARNIGRSELQVLQYVQDHHPVAVSDVAAHFARTRGHVRTTTLNVMGRLVKKGYLKRQKIDGVYHYSPRQSKSELLRRLVADFVRGALGGSLSPFMAYLSQDASLSDHDIAELRQLVRQLEKRGPEDRS